MSDFVIGHIRTFVPLVVGVVMTWLARELGVVVDENTSAEVITWVTAVLSGVYYFVVRLVAERLPWAGVFLGVNKAPSYTAD